VHLLAGPSSRPFRSAGARPHRLRTGRRLCQRHRLARRGSRPNQRRATGQLPPGLQPHRAGQCSLGDFRGGRRGKYTRYGATSGLTPPNTPHSRRWRRSTLENGKKARACSPKAPATATGLGARARRLRRRRLVTSTSAPVVILTGYSTSPGLPPEHGQFRQRRASVRGSLCES
jgi:hypothetical protein